MLLDSTVLFISEYFTPNPFLNERAIILVIYSNLHILRKYFFLMDINQMLETVFCSLEIPLQLRAEHVQSVYNII